MGGTCCNSSGDFEIKFKQTNTYTNKISYNARMIKVNIIDNNGFNISLDADLNWNFNEIKNKYCLLIRKSNINKLIFVYKGKVLEENVTLISLDIDKELTIYAFDGNDYNT